MAKMSASGLELHEMLCLLQSNDCNVDEIKSMIHDHLKHNKEAYHLNMVVDFYVNTGHARFQEILIGVREPHDKHLFDKLNDCMKKRVRLKALTLLGYVIHRQPTWLLNICQHAILPSILKMLKTDTDVQNLMCGALVIVTLLPVIPSLVGPFLDDMFGAFTRLASWHTKRPAGVPEVYAMHLHVATYAYFHRLYSMYPCHFMAYLKSYFNSRDRKVNFADTILPMLERVRMHPSLVISSKANELSLNRWRSMETQDIVLECAKVSLDPNEGLREEQITVGILHSALQKLKNSYKNDLVPTMSSSPGRLPFIPLHKDSLLGQAVPPGWSPSYVCGLSTPPPSQQVSPLGSYLGPNFLAGFPTANVRGVKPSVIIDQTSASTSGVTAGKIDLVDPSPISEAVSEHASASSAGEKRKGIEREDSMIDSEVANLTGQHSQYSDQRQHVAGGRGSGQWNQSPYFELMQDSHRGRSFSQGKRGPRRGPRRSSLLCGRSHSLPDLRHDLRYDRSHLAGATASSAAAATAEVTRSVRPHNPDDPTLDASEEALAPLPFQQLFDMVIPRMAKPSDRVPSVARAPLFVEMSPPELLDRYLAKCGELHHARALEESADVGAGTVAGPSSASSSSSSSRSTGRQQSECDVLRGQMQLLHTQLLYERHKREMHAERNRRLLGKAKRAKALEEQTKALENQVALLGREIVTLSATAAAVRRERHETVDVKNGELAVARDELKKIAKENGALLKTNEELVFKLNETTGELRTLQKELHKVQADLFGTHHELQVIQEQVSINGQLRTEIEKLNKELILVIELNQRYLERENLLPERHQHEAEVLQLRQTANHELRTIRSALESRDALLASSRARIAELESALLKRDAVLTQQKRLLKNTKDEYDVQVRAVERKYQARGKVCRHLEDQVLTLQHRVQRLEDASRARLEHDNQRERQLLERGGAAHVPPRDLASPELAALVPEDPVSYFDDVADEYRVRAAPRLPTAMLRRSSQPIDIDLSNPVSRARRNSATKPKKAKDGSSGAGAVGGGGGAAAARSPAEMDFYGGFEGLPESELENRRNYLRRGNEPSVLENITSRSLASLIVELEDAT